MKLKNKVLEALEQNRGGYISGQSLADSLGVTRTAVWKSIESLKNDGYAILSRTNAGYRLEDTEDTLSAEGIRACLHGRCCDTELVMLKTVNSTNTYAKRLASEGKPHGTVVIAEEQTAGRGRCGKSFFSPGGGGLYMSLLLRPGIDVSQALFITTAASVAVCRAIERLTGAEAQIKWVNDIFVRGRKVCGILTEAVTDFDTGAVESVVLGIGVNVRTAQENFPEELRGTAGSLEAEGVTRNMLAAEIICEVLEAVKSIQEPAHMDEYKRRSMLTGRRIKYVYDGTEYSGTVRGINDAGNLAVDTDDGKRQILSSGEVQLARDEEWYRK